MASKKIYSGVGTSDPPPENLRIYRTVHGHINIYGLGAESVRSTAVFRFSFVASDARFHKYSINTLLSVYE